MGLEIRPAVTNGNIRKWRNRMIEEWRDIPNFEGLYLISNLGHVKSVERYKRNNSGTQFVNERLRVLSPDKDGYLRVCLSKDGLHYVKSVHRLVAEKFENVVLPSSEQWEAIIIGTRNPMNSWDKSDSKFVEEIDFDPSDYPCGVNLGNNDLDLMRRLAAGGPVHAKYRRMITVIVTITAPLYWWKEFDTYRVGVEKNSCSTMHKIHAKEFTIDDFSHEHLDSVSRDMFMQNDNNQPYFFCSFEDMLYIQIETLNRARKLYLETKDKKYWWQMIQLLPSSYNQKRTVMMNYEILANIYKSRRNHRLDEWSVEFIEFIKSLPYSELITYEDNKNVG